MSEATPYYVEIQNQRIEAGDSGWISYDLRNNGDNDIAEGELAVRYSALAGSDEVWVYDDILSAMAAGEANSITVRLGENCPDSDDYVVWITILSSGESPAWATVEASVTDGVFSAR